MRRANHEGQWKQLPSGKWRLAQMVDGHRVYGPAAETKSKARALLKEKLEEARRPKGAPEPNFATFYSDQLPRIKAQLSPSTYALYETVYETAVRIHPIGGKKLNELAPDDVQRWVDDLRQPRVKPNNSKKNPEPVMMTLSAASINRYLQCLKAILEHAARTQRIPKNPATPIRAGKVDEHAKVLLDKKGVDKLLKLPMTDRMRLGILLCLHGLRRAEACGLRYEDFDGEGVTIKRQALEVNGKQIIREATKTGKSRWVPVNGALKELLGHGEGYVLATANNTPLRPRNMAREWKNLVDGTDFKDLTLHDLRSTMGMLLLEKGVDVRTASEMMGHSPAMLAKIYARSRKDLKQEALEKVFG